MSRRGVLHMVDLMTEPVQDADTARWEVRVNTVQPGAIGSLEALQERLAEGWEPFAVTWYHPVFNYHLRRLIDGGGAGSQDPSDEAQQRPLRGGEGVVVGRRDPVSHRNRRSSMPSPATAHIGAIRDQYPTDIFPPDSDSPDAKAGTWARQVCDQIVAEVHRRVDARIDGSTDG